MKRGKVKGSKNELIEMNRKKDLMRDRKGFPCGEKGMGSVNPSIV